MVMHQLLTGHGMPRCWSFCCYECESQEQTCRWESRDLESFISERDLWLFICNTFRYQI